MKTERPLWMRGQMIAPQHFQQQAATTAWSIESVARMGALNPWGVQQALFDNALLKQGKLRASHLCVRFADGTLTDTGNADPLPPAMTLPQANELTVVLALPLEYDNGSNCLQPDEKAERPVRWRQAWRQVRNHFGDDVRQIAVMQPELTLRDSQENNDNYQTVPVARLYRDSQGNWLQDSMFIPPLLSVKANHTVPDDEKLSLNLIGTNGQLPRRALQSTLLDTTVKSTASRIRVRNLCAPTLPCYPPDRDRFHWRVLSHLGSSFLWMMDNADVLRGALSLYDWTDNPRIIEADNNRLTLQPLKEE